VPDGILGIEKGRRTPAGAVSTTTSARGGWWRWPAGWLGCVSPPGHRLEA